MSRPRKKMLDPAWQAERRRDHHRIKTAVTVRLESDHKAAWQRAAEASGLTLAAWLIRAGDRAAGLSNPKGEYFPE